MIGKGERFNKIKGKFFTLCGIVTRVLVDMKSE